MIKSTQINHARISLIFQNSSKSVQRVEHELRIHDANSDDNLAHSKMGKL